MDNKISSILKRSLKVITSYLTALILFGVFSATVMSFGAEAAPAVMPWLSFAVFWVLFFVLYVEMRNFARKEKRPQYNINPPFYKGVMYGLIGIAPLLLIQIIIIAISVPPDFLAFRLRMFQLFSSPLYWLAKLMGNGIPAYMTALASIVITAFLGYWAGYKEFYLATWARAKLGIKKVNKVNKAKR